MRGGLRNRHVLDDDLAYRSCLHDDSPKRSLVVMSSMWVGALGGFSHCHGTGRCTDIEPSTHCLRR
jgi:hypothetical protein